jgi:HAD superfamily hydrolase (TIGR01549 family)
MFNPDEIKAVVFDYGNTLIEFSRKQIKRCDEAQAEALELLYGPFDIKRFHAIRERNRKAPYAGDPPEHRENDLHQITREMVIELYHNEPTQAEIEALIRVRADAFLDAVEAAGDVRPTLASLKSRKRLGLLSNYPDGDTIRASLENIGYADLFDCIVVSGDLGFAKPHPRPFEVVAKKLGVSPKETLHVGDNWLADVQGGKRAGMFVARMERWEPAETFERKFSDYEPDLVVHSVAEVEAHV